MKAVILAGGYGTRLSEETHLKPKPMVEIGNKPILWHIMKFYSSYGIKDFIICCGYKGYIIKEYFNNYFLHTSDLSISLKNNSIESFKKTTEDWKITLVDTGEDSMTGGRLKRVKEHLGGEDFCFTYGDGLSDINIDNLIRFHKKSNKLATVSAVYPPARFGALLRNQKETVQKLMADILFCPLKLSTILKMIFQYGKKIPLSVLLQRENFQPMIIKVIGLPWIPYEIRNI